MPASLSHGLGRKAKLMPIDGTEYLIQPLDITDMADLEDEIGSIELLQVTDTRHLKLLIWLVLRKHDDRLTPEDLDECRYKMTPGQASKLIPMASLMNGEAYEFGLQVCRLAGLIDEAKEAAHDAANGASAEGNAQAPDQKPDSGAKI